MTILTDHHHLFLQAMLLRRTAPFKTWETIFKKCRSLVEARDREQNFESLIRDLNHRLEPLGFRITQTVDGGIGPIDESEQDQVSDESGGNIYPRQQGERWLGLINTKLDNSSKLATELTPAELKFFRRMISKIIRSPNRRYCITFFEAIRIHNKIQGMKKIDAQNVLNVLIKKGWLSHISGVYTLSIRSQLELEPYFEKTFEPEELPPKCFACRNTVMRGFQCPNGECRGALHVHCNATWKKTQTKCSECKGRWSNEIRIGQDAPDEHMSDTEESDTEVKDDDEDDDEERTQQTQTQTQVSTSKRRIPTSSQKTQKKSRNSRATIQDSDEKEEEEEEDQGEGPSQARNGNGRITGSRRSSRHG